MLLSDELISQLVKVTNDRQADKGNVVVYGTIKDDGNRKYVQIDGSEERTPVETTVEIASGDRVAVSVKNHTATVTGNISDPAIGTKTANGLRSSITQTAAEIRMELSDEVNKLNSSLSLTASEIRAELSDEVNGLNSSIQQNADSITTLVSNQDEFSKFQQTVEGFSFMGTGGTVKISGGDINLTGAITFGDLSDDVADEINTATDTANSALSTANDASDTADAAYTRAGTAITRANNAEDVADIAYELALANELPDYLHSTYIDETLVMSPTIIGGRFYAVDEDSYTEMNSDGLYIYSEGAVNPKIELSYSNSGGSGSVQVVLGVGSSNESEYNNRLYIEKTSTAAGIYYYNSNGEKTGFRFSLNGTITVYRADEATTL